MPETSHQEVLDLKIDIAGYYASFVVLDHGLMELKPYQERFVKAFLRPGGIILSDWRNRECLINANIIYSINCIEATVTANDAASLILYLQQHAYQALSDIAPNKSKLLHDLYTSSRVVTPAMILKEHARAKVTAARNKQA